MASLTQIQRQIAKLQAKAEIEQRKQTAGAVAEVHKLMAKHGLSVSDLGQGPKRRGRPPLAERIGSGPGRPKGSLNGANHVGFPVGKMPPKYRDPKTGATWSGHARPPAWIANVKDRTKFLINPADATSVATKGAVLTKVVKPGAKSTTSKGALPAKYRDPKTGATWSGWARPPAWIASVKDRTKFLINPDDISAGIPLKRSAKTAAKKSAAAKSLSSTKLAASPKKATSAAKKTTSAAVKKSAVVAAKKPAAAKKTAAAKKVAGKKVAASAPVSKKAVAKKPVAKKAVMARKGAVAKKPAAAKKPVGAKRVGRPVAKKAAVAAAPVASAPVSTAAAAPAAEAAA
jgi:DNA-binding protein H-NS